MPFTATRAPTAHNWMFGALAYLSQTLSTTPGAVYSISFWFHIPPSKTNNDFQVSWNGTLLLEMTNFPVIGWTNIQLTEHGDCRRICVQFRFRDDIHISVWMTLASRRCNLSASRRFLVRHESAAQCHCRTVRAHLLPADGHEPLGTTQPMGAGGDNVLATDGNFSLTATNAVDRNVTQRLYLLQLQ